MILRKAAVPASARLFVQEHQEAAAPASARQLVQELQEVVVTVSPSAASLSRIEEVDEERRLLLATVAGLREAAEEAMRRAEAAEALCQLGIEQMLQAVREAVRTATAEATAELLAASAELRLLLTQAPQAPSFQQMPREQTNLVQHDQLAGSTGASSSNSSPADACCVSFSTLGDVHSNPADISGAVVGECSSPAFSSMSPVLSSSSVVSPIAHIRCSSDGLESVGLRPSCSGLLRSSEGDEAAAASLLEETEPSAGPEPLSVREVISLWEKQRSAVARPTARRCTSLCPLSMTTHRSGSLLLSPSTSTRPCALQAKFMDNVHNQHAVLKDASS